MRMKYKQEMEKALRLICSAQEVLNDVLCTNTDGCLNVEDFKLNPNKTYKNFIKGESNKLAYEVGNTIAKELAQSERNPFYVFGPSGCGKSHLINAIGLKSIELNPDRNVMYVTAQQFLRQYVDTVRYNTTSDFINFYQAADMLIVDDIQEWKNMHKTVDAFLHIFNYLMENGKQVILASDCSFAKLESIKKNVQNRFASGVLAELEKPDTQLCIDIINARCLESGLKLPADIVECIAKTANGSVCELEGITNSLKVYSSVNNVDIDMDITKRIVGCFVKLKK